MLSNIPAFKVPVVIWIDARDPSKGKLRISTPGRGLGSLNRHGLEALRADPLWTRASVSLARAKVEKTPETLEHARIALLDLARAAGSLADESAAPPNGFDAAAVRMS